MEFNIKQKIVIGIIVIILVIGGIYVYNIRLQEDWNDENANEDTAGILDNILDNETYNDIKASENIIVHVTGAVNNEGIVEIKEGARVADAIKKAGGHTNEADLSKINLAYVLEDGQKIYVPYIGEENDSENKKTYISDNYGDDNNIEGSSNEVGSDKVNINTANQTELETLPGVGTATASKIINYRNQNGKFKSIDDLKNVKGIGDSKFESIKENICIK